MTGRDLKQLGIKQGKQIGDILKMLLEQVVEDPDRNEREYLLKQVRLYLDGDSYEKPEAEQS